MLATAAAATAMGSGFLFIDAIDPAGTANPAVFDRIGRIFRTTEPYEPFLGGEPVEDVAVWFSVDSQMDFADNGTPMSAIGLSSNHYPHGDAVRGACRALQRAHVPFGVVTRKQLEELDRWKVLVLPNVLRTSEDELDAFRAYVERGGRLYASRWTSLVDTAGRRRPDLGLADVLGCRVTGEEQGRIVYLRPASDDVAAAVAPQGHVSVSVDPRPLCGVPRLAHDPAGRVLAALTLPYAYPAPGNVKDRAWASIHSSPPWEDTAHPVLVAHDTGRGRAVYCAADIETVDAEANERLFVHLIRSLLPGPPSATADCHPAIWLNVFDQPDRGRTVVSFLHHAADLPPLPAPVTFILRPPPCRRFTGLVSAPTGEPVDHTVDGDGVLSAHLPAVGVLAMVAASYA